MQPESYGYFEQGLGRRKDFSAIKITPTGNDLNTYGKVQYYKQDENGLSEDGDEIPYVKKEMLLGALFAEDSEFYQKSVEKALNKLDIISTIYKNNSMALEQYSENDLTLSGYGCPSSFEGLTSEINDILLNSKQITYDNFIELHDSSKEIDDYNTELILNSCPILY